VWVLDLLQKLKGGADEGGAACDSGFADLIFTTARGEPINEEYLVKKHFKPLLREAGLPNIRLYDLRHTSATLAEHKTLRSAAYCRDPGLDRGCFTKDCVGATRAYKRSFHIGCVFTCIAPHAG
jgi:integrase